MSAIIHLNDNNILVQKGEEFTRSQGYAWLSGTDVHFDFDSKHLAVKHCRLEPQQINSSYWQQCAQTAISKNDSGMRHAADLIWRHLSELQSSQTLNDVNLVVPSHYQAENLQLLLGICKASNLQARSVTNKAVLVLAQHAIEAGRYLHVDVQLHQTVCSEVIVKLDSAACRKINLGEVEVLHEVGLQSMQDALLKAIQERFILSDRFDPLHYAETEQQLFDQLSGLANSIKDQGKANVSVRYQGREHATSIDLKQWNAALEPYTLALNKASVGAQTDQRYFDFNGFVALGFFDDAKIELVQNKLSLSYPGDILRKLMNERSQGDEDKIIYRTELSIDTDPSLNLAETGGEQAVPRAHETSALVDVRPKQLDTAPTHLLQAGLAVPTTMAKIELEGGSMKLYHSTSSNVNELLKSEKIFVMGDPSRIQLQVEDRLGSDLADGVISAIQVLDAPVKPEQGG